MSDKAKSSNDVSKKTKKKKKKKAPIDVSLGALNLELGFFARLGLLTASAACIFLSFPTFNIWPISFFSLPLFLIAIHDLSPKRAFVAGSYMGFVTNTGGFYWISSLLMDFAHMSWLVSMAICLFMTWVQGLQFALLGWILRKARVGGLDWPSWALVLPVFLGLEFVFPMLFPWYMGTLLFLFHPAVQIAEILGVQGVSIVVLLPGLILYALLEWKLGRRDEDDVEMPKRFLAGASLAVVVALVFGVVRIGQVDAEMEAAEKMRIGLVEGNIGISEKENAEKLDNNILIHQNLSAEIEKDGPVDLIVWPESSYQSLYTWGSTEPGEDILFLELDSLFVERFRDAALPGMRVLETAFGRRLDHHPDLHRSFHRALAYGASTQGYEPLDDGDLAGVPRIDRETKRIVRPLPYPYRCGERDNVHLKCPFVRVPPDDLTFLLPGRERLQPDVVADRKANTFVWNQRAVQRGFDAPLLFGGLTINAKEGTDMDYQALLRASKLERDLYNVALLADSDGRVRGNYKKVYLLLFGETIPGADLFPEIYDIIPEAGSFTAGTEPMAFDIGGHRVGMMICYEDILPAFARRLAQLEPQVVINVTNDAWFGKTAEPHQHLALATIRAVEMRTYLIRSTNTGVSAFIDANGRVVGETDLDNPEVLVHDVAVMSGKRTIYARIGDVLGWTGLGFALILTVLFWSPIRLEDEAPSEPVAN